MTAMIVGRGHNRLTAAAYLGVSTLVSERSGIVGGCCVTGRPPRMQGLDHPLIYIVASILRPEVVLALGIADHGLRMIAYDPAI